MGIIMCTTSICVCVIVSSLSFFFYSVTLRHSLHIPLANINDREKYGASANKSNSATIAIEIHIERTEFNVLDFPKKLNGMVMFNIYFYQIVIKYKWFGFVLISPRLTTA